MERFLSRLILAGIFPMLAGLSACANHADFVNLQHDVREAAKEQRQAHAEAQEQRDALQRRVQALEVARESSDLNQRLEQLTARLLTAEERLSRLEQKGEAQAAPPRESTLRSGAGGEDFPSLYKPVDQPPVMQEEPGRTLSGITPTSAFNLAYNDYLNGRYELAIVGFQRFLQDFPSTSLAPRAYYWLGESYYSQKDYVRAIQALDHVAREYPSHEKVPAALFKIGLAAEETGDRAKARGYLKQVIENYSTSNEAKLAKNKLAELR